MQASIAARNCELWFLPAYSSDLLPIEMPITKVKEGLRREGARDEQRLESAIMQTLPAVSAADAQGFLPLAVILVVTIGLNLYENRSSNRDERKGRRI